MAPFRSHAQVRKLQELQRAGKISSEVIAGKALETRGKIAKLPERIHPKKK